METRLKVIFIILLILHLEILLWRLFLVVDSVSVHDTHVVNTVFTYLPVVTD